MSRKKIPYISYEDFEKFLGKKNTLKFYEALIEKFDSSFYENRKKYIQIYFLDYTNYLKCDWRADANEDVPETYYILYELEKILDSDILTDLLYAFQGTRLYISYTHIRNRLVYNELEKGNSPKDVAKKYDLKIANVYQIKKRYRESDT